MMYLSDEYNRDDDPMEVMLDRMFNNMDRIDALSLADLEDQLETEALEESQEYLEYVESM